MFAKKSISRILFGFLTFVFLLIGVPPVQAEAPVNPLYATGDFLWGKSMGGTGMDSGYRIPVDSSGNVYTTGFFSGIADFDPGTGISNLTSVGSGDIFVSKLNSSGDFLWVKGMGGTSDDGGTGITVDSSGNVYTTGFFLGTADFDPGIGTSSLTSAGIYDIFISKLENEVTSIPTQFVVTKTADTNDGACDSDCSLREAIATAPTGTTINFVPNLSGATINLTSTLILYRDVILDGSALDSKITISGDTDNDGAGDVRVFNVNNGVTAALNSLVITKGLASGVDGDGGGISNDGMLIVTNSKLSDNSAIHYGGGISNNGTLTVTNSTLSTNTASGGGGIFTYGALTVTNSTIAGNTASGGGGIMQLSFGVPISISNSTLSGNSAQDGGGIYVQYELTATNSTIVGNSATDEGGGVYSTGVLKLINTTFSGNSALTSGGGIYNGNILEYANTIIANSTSGGDCFTNQWGGVIKNIHNLAEDDSCSASLNGDPNLGPLADNGGSTQTMALLPTSPAINAGDNDTCEITDQRGITRPQGAHCDIGAFEYVNDTPPLVLSINRVNTNPTSASSVRFTVTFSELVTGVDTTSPQFDGFSLNSLGISDAFITNVSGSGITYTVTVNTGTGNGTIRLEVPDTATITDMSGQPLANLPFTSGEIYTIIKGTTFSSIAPNDGWVLEKSETSNQGGTKNTNGLLRIGDDAKNRQYRLLLYFDTSSLPNNAIISRVTLKIKQAGIAGANPFTTHGELFADMAKGFFGKSALENADFQARGVPRPNVGRFTPVAGELDWYQLVLSPANFQYINLNGVTQFRLRFAKDDDNDKKADFITFYSGDDATSPPQLIVEYTTP
jgi:CSLREA domain-containing protein